MKFHQVAVGQRFEFEGKWYVKNRPLTAVHEASGQVQMMRRSADVTLPGAQVPAKPAAKMLEAKAVRAAFEDFHAQCVACLDGKGASKGADSSASARKLLEDARTKFLDTLSLK